MRRRSSRWGESKSIIREEAHKLENNCLTELEIQKKKKLKKHHKDPNLELKYDLNSDEDQLKEQPLEVMKKDCINSTKRKGNSLIERPNFGLSGALYRDIHQGSSYNGVVLKFTEPPEARTPNTKWRLYVFKRKTTRVIDEINENINYKNDSHELIQVLHISKQSAYLFGRDRKVVDIPVDHPSLSKQHCVLQYRALLSVKDNKFLCKPYIMDLDSTNGTFLNGIILEEARYYELRRGDVIRLGGSTREYVILTENTTVIEIT